MLPKNLQWIDNPEIIRKWLSQDELKELRKFINELRNNKEVPSVKTTPTT